MSWPHLHLCTMQLCRLPLVEHMHNQGHASCAFTTLGLYEFNQLPQGLCNSPASFMHLMVLRYLDDVLTYAPSEEEAIRSLQQAGTPWFVPFYLMDGHIPRLPGDVMFFREGRDDDIITGYNTYLRRMRITSRKPWLLRR